MRVAVKTSIYQLAVSWHDLISGHGIFFEERYTTQLLHITDQTTSTLIDLPLVTDSLALDLWWDGESGMDAQHGMQYSQRVLLGVWGMMLT